MAYNDSDLLQVSVIVAYTVIHVCIGDTIVYEGLISIVSVVLLAYYRFVYVLYALYMLIVSFSIRFPIWMYRFIQVSVWLAMVYFMLLGGVPIATCRFL